MKMILIGFLTLLGSASFAGSPRILLGSLPGTNFNAMINEQDPTKLDVENTLLGKTSTYNFRNTISEIRKLTLTTAAGASQEMLLVIISVANAVQTVKIYIPVANTAIPLRSQKLNPVCEFTNEGSFLGEDDNELQGKFRIQNNQMIVKIGSYDGKTAPTFKWKECFTF